MGCVYLVTNKINGKQYVGKTIETLRRRRKKHESSVKNDDDRCILFHRALRKYGFDNFDWEIIYDNIDSNEELCRLEIESIAWFNSRKNGYNMTDGGEGTVGWNPSKETKKKISDAHIGLPAWNKGMKTDPAAIAKKIATRKANYKPAWNKGLTKHTSVSIASGCAKMSEFQKKRMQTEEGKRTIQKAIASRSGEHYLKGKHLSDETKQKLRLSHLGKKHTPESIEKMKNILSKVLNTPEYREKQRQLSLGRKHTTETLEKMRGRKHTPEKIEKMRKIRQDIEAGKRLEKLMAKKWL